MTTTSTWMPMYWGDYLRDTGHLSAAEHGAYLLLIGHYWATSSVLPDDDEKLRRLARMERSEWKSARITIAAFFKIGEGVWRHDRIERELADSKCRKETNEKRAKAAASKRWGIHRDSLKDAPSMQQELLEECPPPSPSQDSVADATGVETPPDEESLSDEIWTQILNWLAKNTDKPRDKLRPVLGKWVKEVGEEAVVTICRKAAMAGKVEPISWIEAQLKGIRDDKADQADTGNSQGIADELLRRHTEAARVRRERLERDPGGNAGVVLSAVSS